MKKHWLCRLGIHNTRTVMRSAHADIRIVQCVRCGKFITREVF